MSDILKRKNEIQKKLTSSTSSLRSYIEVEQFYFLITSRHIQKDKDCLSHWAMAITPTCKIIILYLIYYYSYFSK